MINCSVVIIAHNAENTIHKCVKSALLISNDVWVVEDNSTDKTNEIAKEAGANILNLKWQGYSKTKNAGSKNALNDLIFWLDADEEIPEELAKEINNIKVEPNTCYAINRLNFFAQKPIHFGAWNPDWQVRIYNKKQIHWNEQQEVHETLVLPKEYTTVKLKERLHHYTTPSYQAYHAKMKLYGSRFNPNKKLNLIKLLFSPPVRFINEYFFKLGFLDGKEGLQLACLHLLYTIYKYR